MGWERRARGGHYYTRSRRVGGRVVREYVGCGQSARVIAELDELDREERQVARAEREQEQVESETSSRAMLALEEALDECVGAVLTAGGYHQHRGQWRRRRSE